MTPFLATLCQRNPEGLDKIQSLTIHSEYAPVPIKITCHTKNQEALKLNGKNGNNGCQHQGDRHVRIT